MYLTDFERWREHQHIKVYKNARQLLLLDIDRFERDRKMMRENIQNNDYKYYAMWKSFLYRSYRNIKISALIVLKYMLVWAYFTE